MVNSVSTEPSGWDSLDFAQIAVDGSGNALQTAINLPATSGQTNSAAGNDGVVSRICRSAGKFTNGPGGHTDYYDNVFGFGQNLAQNFTTRVNSALGAMSCRIESNYYQSGRFVTEFIVATVDLSDVEHRLIYATVPQLAAAVNAESVANLSAGVINFFTGNGPVTGTQRIKFDNGAAEAIYYTSWKNTYDVNNTRIDRQKNVAGNGYVDRAYINDRDENQIGNSTLYIVGAAKTNALGSTSQICLLNTASVTNDGGIVVNGGTNTGIYNPIAVTVSAAVQAVNTLSNTHATGRNIVNLTSVGGDCLLCFGVATKQWSIGGDATTGELRFCAADQDVDSGTKLSIARTSGLATFAGNIVGPLTTPASAAAAGVAGTITWDASFIYICTATNTWKRVAIATW